MRVFWIYVLLFQLFMTTVTFAQIWEPDPGTRDQLVKLARDFQAQYDRVRTQALDQARAKGWPIVKVLSNGVMIEIQGLVNNGMPIYYTTHNRNAAKTVATNLLWPGTNSGLNLTGNGMIVGEWDGNGVLRTHRELAGRVTQIDIPGNLSNHATHVAGTLISAGLDSTAIGMAYEARLHAYDWNNDNVEMSLAASTGLTLSNHSYGYITGWSYDFRADSKWYWFGDPGVNPNEDYYFGFYSQYAKEWDTIAFNAPHYLMVVSAGNDREDYGPDFSSGEDYWLWDKKTDNWVFATTPRDPDGEYDCISHKSLAKNLLTVGAVDDIPGGYSQPNDVHMTQFSAWGPTDDGRIKPDLVANGIALRSTTAGGDASYASYSGTSMAAPNVCGSLLLLQQHYRNLHAGKNLRAATLKALALHTADEAGDAPGPDYRFGWGLFNAFKAANVITYENKAHLIREESLARGGNYSLKVDATGLEPLRVTICWTDPAGTPPEPSLDPPNKMLVNDLDLRIEGPNKTFYPWILDPSNPTHAATTGDNISDNVEQVLVASPVETEYWIRVTHKPSLKNDLQAFSLVVSGNKPVEVPVEMTLFVGHKTTDGIELVWQTASESNNYGFQVERRAVKSVNWDLIGFVPGHGTTATTQNYRFLDAASAALTSATLQYRLKQIDNDGAFEYSDVLTIFNSIPVTFSLGQNYPNPVSRSAQSHDNLTTRITFEIPIAGHVNLSLFNVLGQKIAQWVNEEKEPGRYSFSFRLEALPDGIYFYTLRTSSFRATQKMIILR